MPIHYLKGDATSPQAEGNAIIAHVCNDQGGWGRGFVVAISDNWPEPEEDFRAWYDSGEEFELGAVRLVQVETDLWVANMIGQHGIGAKSGVPPIRYPAVETALEAVAKHAKSLNATVHMPRIGCGLAGGEWSRIEPIIERTLVAGGVEVFVYDLDDE